MEHENESETFQKPPVCLKFKALPKEIQERILKRLEGEGEGFVFKTDGILSSYVLSGLSLGWFILLFLLADDYLWSRTQIVIFSLLSLAASYLFIRHVYKIARWLPSKTKCRLLITPVNVTDIYFDDVRFWTLEQLLSAEIVRQNPGSEYKSPQIVLTFGSGSKIFKVKDRQHAEHVCEQIDVYRKLYIEATVRGDAAYLNAENDFRELDAEPGRSNYSTARVLLGRVAAAASTLR